MSCHGGGRPDHCSTCPSEVEIYPGIIVFGIAYRTEFLSLGVVTSHSTHLLTSLTSTVRVQPASWHLGAVGRPSRSGTRCHVVKLLATTGSQPYGPRFAHLRFHAPCLLPMSPSTVAGVLRSLTRSARAPVPARRKARHTRQPAVQIRPAR